MTRRPRPTLLVAVVALLALPLAACGSGDEADGASDGDTRLFTADNGEIEIPTDPERVVATGYAVPALIEADAALVGISEFSRSVPIMTDEHLAVYEDLPKVAGDTAASTNYEVLAELEPDLIVLGIPEPVMGDIDMERLESIAPVVAIGPTLPDEWRENTRDQADAAGSLEGYEAAKEAYDAKAAELTEQYADQLDGLAFGHVGAYGESSAGTFQREFAGSWGTNIATDIGVEYYGEVEEKGPGSAAVSEYPSIEELSDSLGEADAITYTVTPDGTPAPSVQYVLDSPLWQDLPAVEDGMVFPIRFTEAATYTQALQTLDAIDQAFGDGLTP